MSPRIVLSTASFFPDTELGFRMAAEHGYDGVEVMITHDRRSQSVEAVRDLSYSYGVPIRAIHVPCLVVTQHVWGWNPEVKLRRSIDMALAVGADVVVVHPPFRWQRDYANAFPELVAGYNARPLSDGQPGPAVTVENMFSVEAFGRRVEPYRCHDDPAFGAFGSLTLDTSHAGANRQDVLELYALMRGRVRHLHLSDSTMTRGDEHLPPGRGKMPLRDLAEQMSADGFDGHVVLEVAIGRLPEGSRSTSTGECLTWAREAFAGELNRTPRAAP